MIMIWMLNNIDFIVRSWKSSYADIITKFSCTDRFPISIVMEGLLLEWFNPFAPKLPVTARADPGPFYPLWRHQF